MSVLVFDGMSLATDSFANNGDQAFPYQKLWRTTAYPITTTSQAMALCCVVGPLSLASALRHWCNTGLSPSEFPSNVQPSSGAQLVVVSKEKGLLRYNGSPIPHLHGLNKIAIGEGAPFAYGAMDYGATAEQAVATAIKYSVHCNGVPEVLHL